MAVMGTIEIPHGKLSRPLELHPRLHKSVVLLVHGSTCNTRPNRRCGCLAKTPESTPRPHYPETARVWRFRGRSVLHGGASPASTPASFALRKMSQDLSGSRLGQRS